MMYFSCGFSWVLQSVIDRSFGIFFEDLFA